MIVIDTQSFVWTQVSPQHLTDRSVELDMHGDPFDRIIVATAQTLGLPLVTSDRKIIASQLVSTIW